MLRFRIGFAETDHGDTAFLHHGAHVGEVEVDEAGFGDEFRDPLHRAHEHLVADLEGLPDGEFADRIEQPVVGNDDDGIAHVAQAFEAGFGVRAPDLALCGERRGDDGDGERAGVAGGLGDDGGCAGAGPTAEAGGHEDHIRALDLVVDLLLTFEGGLLADLRERARAAALRFLLAHQDLAVGLDVDEMLDIGVGRDELRALNALLVHAVDRVAAAAAAADDRNVGLQVTQDVLELLIGHRAGLWITA